MRIIALITETTPVHGILDHIEISTHPLTVATGVARAPTLGF
jgi:hypothetical protein